MHTYIFSSVSNQFNNHLTNFIFSRSMDTNNKESLGGDGLIDEMCKGFQLLMDRDKGVFRICLSNVDLWSMLREGDFDGDGALSQMEVWVLMFRLSPDLMDQYEFLLEEATDIRPASRDDEDDNCVIAATTVAVLIWLFRIGYR
ncbi:putative EF-hand domain-containing protein [Helianthus anomalus]